MRKGKASIGEEVVSLFVEGYRLSTTGSNPFAPIRKGDSWNSGVSQVQAFTFISRSLSSVRLSELRISIKLLEIAPENPVLWTGMKGASVEDRKNVVYETT